MQTLKEILGEERYNRYFKNHSPDEFHNWGLGVMSNNERAELLNLNAIKTINGEDFVNSDAWCVKTFYKDEAKCVFEGSKFDCEMERDRIHSMKPELKVEMANYPKSYFEYYENKRKQSGARDFEEQSQNNLINEMGF